MSGNYQRKPPKKSSEPYPYCLETPKRCRCCRVTDQQPCSAMTQRLEHLEREFDREVFTVEEYGNLLVELLPGRCHGYGDSVVPETPTTHKAGSEEKIELMRLRVSLGQSPCHPDDTRQRVCRAGGEQEESRP